MTKLSKTEILGILWMLSGLLYILWGIYWFINYTFTDALWLTMIPYTHLFRSLSFGGLFIINGMLLFKHSNCSLKYPKIILIIVLTYDALIILQELIFWHYLYNQFYLADFIILVVLLYSSLYLKKITKKEGWDSATNIKLKNIITALSGWIVIPFIISLIFDYLRLHSKLWE